MYIILIFNNYLLNNGCWKYSIGDSFTSTEKVSKKYGSIFFMCSSILAYISFEREAFQFELLLLYYYYY